jgi:hypothetical protein
METKCPGDEVAVEYTSRENMRKKLFTNDENISQI